MSIVLQEPVRLSRSVLWQLQRRYFAEQGIDAWRSDTVPSYVTSNPYIARAYARVIRAFWRDWSAEPETTCQRDWSVDVELARRLDPNQPAYVVELGAGLGQFGYLLLRQLLSAPTTDPGQSPIKLVLTDFAEKTIAFWRGHPSLRPFVERGQLDFAVFDAERPAPLHLIESGAVLAAGPVNNPFVVIANYLFDGIPQDVFAVRDRRLFEVRYATSSEQPEADPGDPDPLKWIDLTHALREVERPYYGDPTRDAILEDYRTQLGEACFSFPTSGLDCLRFLRDLAGDRLLILSGDKGFSQVADLKGREVPQMARHGSLSLEVNFHALGEYTRREGGWALHPAYHPTDMTISALAFGTPVSGYGEMARAYREAIEEADPGDFYQITQIARRVYASMTPEQFLAFLRVSGWDPLVMFEGARELAGKAAEMSDRTRQALALAAGKVWENHYPIGDNIDLAFRLGMLLAALEEYAQASVYFARSARLYGVNATTSCNLAACYYCLGDRDQTRHYIEESLRLDPTNPDARALWQAIEGE